MKLKFEHQYEYEYRYKFWSARVANTKKLKQ